MAKAFKLKVDKGMGIVTFDLPGEKVNIITPKVLGELETVLEKLEAKRDDLTGVIFISGKEDSYIAGADISTIESVIDPEEGQGLAEIGQWVLPASRRFPTLQLQQSTVRVLVEAWNWPLPAITG